MDTSGDAIAASDGKVLQPHLVTQLARRCLAEEGIKPGGILDRSKVAAARNLALQNLPAVVRSLIDDGSIDRDLSFVESVYVLQTAAGTLVRERAPGGAMAEIVRKVITTSLYSDETRRVIHCWDPFAHDSEDEEFSGFDAGSKSPGLPKRRCVTPILM